MRLVVMVILIAMLPGGAQAAPNSWLTELFPPAPAHLRHKPALPEPPTPLDRPLASAPAESAAPVPLPRPRPATETAAAEANSTITANAGPAGGPTPPGAGAAGESVHPPATAAPATGSSGEQAPAPPPVARIYQTACPAVIDGAVEAKPLPPISEGQCGAQSPLSVTGILVNGRLVPLSTAATVTCPMASDLPSWVAEVDAYAEATLRTRIKSVTIGGSYECRPRNTPDHDESLSEHGRADAIDFVGFVLENGRTLTVGGDYGSADASAARLMHFAHDAACTRFTTVLGPEANSLHHDHFHLDLGCHGKACTYRLCE